MSSSRSTICPNGVLVFVDPDTHQIPIPRSEPCRVRNSAHGWNPHAHVERRCCGKGLYPVVVCASTTSWRCGRAGARQVRRHVLWLNVGRHETDAGQRTVCRGLTAVNSTRAGRIKGELPVESPRAANAHRGQQVPVHVECDAHGNSADCALRKAVRPATRGRRPPRATSRRGLPSRSHLGCAEPWASRRSTAAE